MSGTTGAFRSDSRLLTAELSYVGSLLDEAKAAPPVIDLADAVDPVRDHVRSGKHAARVSQDVNSAGEAGVAGTPSFFINEVRYRGAYDLESLGAAVSQAGSTVENRAAAAEELD